MAITNLTTYAHSDLVTLKEASALMRATTHPVSEETLRRLLIAAGKRSPGRRGRADLYSMEDVFAVHRSYVKVRDGC